MKGFLLNIPFVHVCVDRHSRSSPDQQFRAQGSAHRMYYCCTFSIVHVETYSWSVVSGAVLCYAKQVSILLYGAGFARR